MKNNKFIGFSLSELLIAMSIIGIIATLTVPNLMASYQKKSNTEVDLLIGDSTKAREKLNWKPKYDIYSLAKEMVEEDLKKAEKEAHIKSKGFEISMLQEV